MKKIEDFIKQYFIDNNIPLYFNNYDTVLITVYGYRKVKTNNYQYSKFWKTYFPDKIKHITLANYILKLNNLKYCTSCDTIHDIKNFSICNSRSDKLQGKCKDCEYIYGSNWKKKNRKKHRATSAKYRAVKLKRTPKWANLEKIKLFYENCPEGYEVDHIIPLQGENISGLHVLENLQYLTIEENRRKGNKYVAYK